MTREAERLLRALNEAAQAIWAFEGESAITARTLITNLNNAFDSALEAKFAYIRMARSIEPESPKSKDSF